MVFDSWSAFWHMGGYAFYVWTAFAVTLAILIINVIVPLVRRKKLLKNLAYKWELQEKKHDPET